jgi:hypothetical protein
MVALGLNGLPVAVIITAVVAAVAFSLALQELVQTAEETALL